MTNDSQQVEFATRLAMYAAEEMVSRGYTQADSRTPVEHVQVTGGLLNRFSVRLYGGRTVTVRITNED